MHLPVTAGYYEDKYFRVGDTGYPVVEVAGAVVGFPTCWDEWFPEVARVYALHGAEVIVYPTAIGSEPDHPDFDTEPLWEQVIRAHGITNGTFMVVPNRIGTEGPGHVLRLFVHQRPVRARARAGAARRAGGARRRSRPRPGSTTGWTCSRSCARGGRRRTDRWSTTFRGKESHVPIAEQIACMECGETAVLVQAPTADEVIEPGDVLVYRCPECLQRWDVVVDEDDLVDDDDPYRD